MSCKHLYNKKEALSILDEFDFGCNNSLKKRIKEKIEDAKEEICSVPAEIQDGSMFCKMKKEPCIVIDAEHEPMEFFIYRILSEDMLHLYKLGIIRHSIWVAGKNNDYKLYRKFIDPIDRSSFNKLKKMWKKK